MGQAVVLAVVLLMAVSCEGADDASQGTGGTVQQSSAASTSSTTPASKAGGLCRRSDVASVPAQPVVQGAVVVVPGAVVASFWTAVGLPAGGPPVPGKAEFLVEPAVMPPGVVGAPIQNGRFVSTVDAARALLCLADDLPATRRGPRSGSTAAPS